MSETGSVILGGLPETAMVALYLRAMDSHRPDALIRDEKAVELVERISYGFEWIREIPLSEDNKTVRILFSREMDRYARDFLGRHADAVVVHIGCGLDTRFERVDDGRVEWYDLDLPEIIELRRRLIGDEGERSHLLGCSVFEDAWLEQVSMHRGRALLFLADTVFLYCELAQVKSLVLQLRNCFPGAEMVLDALSPLHVWVTNLQVSRSKFGARARWGIWHGQEIERWGDGIHLLDEWGFFDRPEPRLAHIRWARPLDAVARTARIYHFRLGEIAG